MHLDGQALTVRLVWNASGQSPHFLIDGVAHPAHREQADGQSTAPGGLHAVGQVQVVDGHLGGEQRRAYVLLSDRVREPGAEPCPGVLQPGVRSVVHGVDAIEP